MFFKRLLPKPIGPQRIDVKSLRKINLSLELKKIVSACNLNSLRSFVYPAFNTNVC